MLIVLHTLLSNYNLETSMQLLHDNLMVVSGQLWRYLFIIDHECQHKEWKGEKRRYWIDVDNLQLQMKER